MRKRFIQKGIYIYNIQRQRERKKNNLRYLALLELRVGLVVRVDLAAVALLVPFGVVLAEALRRPRHRVVAPQHRALALPRRTLAPAN